MLNFSGKNSQAFLLKSWFCPLSFFGEERTKDPIENAKRPNMSVVTFAIAMAKENRPPEKGIPTTHVWNRRPVPEYYPSRT
jgi:hypothetical protein